MRAEDVGSIYWQSKIAKLEELNAELLAVLKELANDETMPGRFLPLIAAAIAKAEGRE